MCPSETNRLRIPKLTFQLIKGRNTKIIIFRNDRNDLPHLTVSFNNPTREIDLHLKNRSHGGKEHLLEVFANAMASISISMLQKITEKINEIRKKIRPGWLKRKGYLIIYLDEAAEQDFINYFAPIGKHHGKLEHQINSSSFDNYLKSVDMGKYCYSPSFLHELALHKDKQLIFAFRVWGRHKPKTLPIGLVKRNGKKYWVRLDKFGNRLKNLEPVFLFYWKNVLSEEAWRKISNGLCLEELDDCEKFS